MRSSLARLPLNRSQSIHPRSILLFIAVFATVGSLILVMAHAAVAPTAFEAETGTLTAGATQVVNSAASGGKVLKFGGSTPAAYSCIRSYDAAHPGAWDDPNGGGPGATCPNGNCSSICAYADVPYIVTGDPNNGPYVNQNVWGAVPTSFTQKLYANSPRDWYVTINKPVDNPGETPPNGPVSNYPNLGFNMKGKVDDYATMTSSWNVTIPHNATSVGWAAYDMWFNDDNTEIMIQADIGANPNFNCTSYASATFNGEPWHMCVFGDERVWKRGTDDDHIINKSVGSVDLKLMLSWMEAHTFIDPETHVTRPILAPGSKWQTQFIGASFGFEVPTTSGINADYRVSDFTWNATR